MKQTGSNTTIYKLDDDWELFGTLLKTVEGKSKSERIQEFVKKENKRLERKLLAQDNEASRVYKITHRR